MYKTKKECKEFFLFLVLYTYLLYFVNQNFPLLSNVIYLINFLNVSLNFLSQNRQNMT